MSRYIDADAFAKQITKIRDVQNIKSDTNWYSAYDEFLDLIEDFHTADVREIVRGEWVEAEICNGIQCNACSVCGYSPFYKGEPVLVARTYNFNYCPNCGAKMDERREDDKGRSDISD